MNIRTKKPDLKAIISLIPTEQGGKTRYVISGYMPQHSFNRSKISTSGEHEYLEVEKLIPGDKATAFIRLVEPIYFEGTIKVGDVFQILEGPKLAGTGEVLEIYNSILSSNKIVDE